MHVITNITYNNNVHIYMLYMQLKMQLKYTLKVKNY